MSPRRLGRASIGLALLAPAALGLASLRLQHHRLVRDVNALHDDPHARPVHAPPEIPGTFAELADEEAPEPWLRILLRATHATARGGGIVDVASGNALPWPSRLSFEVVVSLARSAAIDLGVRVRHGDDRALDDCADLLALARDLGLGTRMLGLRLRDQIQAAVMPACTVALEDAPLEARRRFATSVDRIRAGTPPLARVLWEERVYRELEHLGPLLDADDRRELPAGARALVRSGDPTWSDRFRGSFRWSPRDEDPDRAEAARLQGTADERLTALERVARR